MKGTTCFLVALGLIGVSTVLWAGGAKQAPSSAGQAAQGPAMVQIWTKYNDTNPQNSIDKWMDDTVASFKTANGQELKNTFVPWDQITSKVNLAVQSGGDVPDITLVENAIDAYVRNGTLMDITDFVKDAPWFKDISPAVLQACTASDGKIYMVPNLLGGNMVYYWTALYPEGAPKTTADLMKAGERLAKQGKYAITFKGSESSGAQFFYFQMIESFGGTYTDTKGNSIFATPQTVKAVEVIREIFAKKYAPEVCLSAGFDWETPFKDGNAGAMIAGSWSYVYLNPLKSPDGQVFDKGAASVEDAIKAGALGIADVIAAPDGRPATYIGGISGWAIPTGSKNVEGGKAFMNFMMEPRNMADYASAYGAIPTNNQSLQDPRFVNSPYWKEVSASIYRTGKNVPLNKNPKLGQKIDDTIITLIQKPNLNIMTELKKAQDELNTGM